MADLLAETVPLALGAAISPILLLMTVAMLSGQGRTGRTLAFLCGATVPLVAVAVAVIVAGAALSFRASPHALAVVDLLLAALLFLLAGRALARALRERQGSASVAAPADDSSRHAGVAPARAFAVGIGATATNITSLILFLPAVKDVAAAPVALGTRALVAAVLIVITLAMVWLPLSLSLLAPGSADRVLARLAAAFRRNRRRTVIALGFGFGAYLLIRGLGGL